MSEAKKDRHGEEKEDEEKKEWHDYFIIIIYREEFFLSKHSSKYFQLDCYSFFEVKVNKSYFKSEAELYRRLHHTYYYNNGKECVCYWVVII